MEASGGGWEVLRITLSSFLAMGEEGDVGKMSEVGCLTVGKTLIWLVWWSEARGTFPNPPVRRYRVVFEGVLLYLCDDEGVAVLARSFGQVVVGSLGFSPINQFPYIGRCRASGGESLGHSDN